MIVRNMTILIMACDWIEVVSMMISVSNYMDGSHDLAVAHGQSDSLKPFTNKSPKLHFITEQPIRELFIIFLH